MTQLNQNNWFSVINKTNIFIQAKPIIGLHIFKRNIISLKSQQMDCVILIFHFFLKLVQQLKKYKIELATQILKQRWTFTHILLNKTKKKPYLNLKITSILNLILKINE